MEGESMAANGGHPRKPSAHIRKMKPIWLVIVGVVSLIVVSAITESHGNKQPASAQGVASSDAGVAASALATVSVDPATVLPSPASTQSTTTPPGSLHRASQQRNLST
jgi:hypothetical protein